MIYTNRLLNDLRDAIFGNDNVPNIDYDEHSINYNEYGDTYYRIDTYSNNEVKSILVCAKVKNIENSTNIVGYREIYVENDDFYTAIDFVVEHLDEINMSIDKQMEEKQRNLYTK